MHFTSSFALSPETQERAATAGGWELARSILAAWRFCSPHPQLQHGFCLQISLQLPPHKKFSQMPGGTDSDLSHVRTDVLEFENHKSGTKKKNNREGHRQL